jgi:hypothetical protein
MGAPRLLFDTGGGNVAGILDTYAVSRDGQRFLLEQEVEHDNSQPFHVLVNWTSALQNP